MEQNGIKTWQWVVTVVVIIVLIIIGIWVFGSKGSSTPVENPASTTGVTPTSANATNNIVMSDQYPGNVVYLNSVQFANPGWVVVQADSSGVPGKVLGETYFTSGISPGKITLSSSMIDGDTYYAVMYSDNGDQKFDPATDKPITDANGNVIMKVFHASSSVSAEVKG